MWPDPSNLLEQLDMSFPLIGFYDSPNITSFEPLVKPRPGKNVCIYAFFKKWLTGETLHLNRENFGCAGCGNWIFNIMTWKRDNYINFLYLEEGFKSSPELMEKWFDYQARYNPKYGDIFIGPLKKDEYEYLKTITFFVNPDQLSLLITGTQYNKSPIESFPTIAPFGSACMQMVTLFDDLSSEQAIVGTTDIAMRKYVPFDMLSYTVTKPLFEKLCELDRNCFLYKADWTKLKKVRAHRMNSRFE